jgi:hypothetical protein
LDATGIPRWGWTDPIAFGDAGVTASSGGGVSCAQIDFDANLRLDCVFMVVQATNNAADNFVYRIGWNINQNGIFTGQSLIFNLGDAGGWDISGGGVTIANIDGGAPDVLFMVVDNGNPLDNWRYKICWNMNVQGVCPNYNPALGAGGGWGTAGWQSQGGDVALVDVDGNGALDGVFGVIDDPQGLNNLRYVVAWDISGAGANKGSFAAGVSGVRGFRQVPSPTSSDLGMTTVELDGGTVEVIFDVLNANPWGLDEHQYLIGYNANFAGFF